VTRINRSELLRWLQQRGGFSSVADLAAEFEVTPSTIRRHLEVLQQRGVIERRHGSVQAVAPTAELPYAAKMTERQRQKQAIAFGVAHRIGQGQSVLLDSGSTMLEVAKALRLHIGLTIVTDDIRIANEVADHNSSRLIVIGGERLPSVYTLSGPDSIRQIQELSVDVAVLSADAVNTHSVTNATSEEVAVKRAMIECARARYLVADSSKFEKTLLIKVCDLSEFTLGITDTGLDPIVAAHYPIPMIRVPVTQPDGTVPGAEPHDLSRR
jgi:DeoR/GlpR family transcriptional regulator of sugar metabolism